MPVYLGSGGKVLLGPGGKVATSSACCCGGGGGCPDPGCPPITVSASVTFSVDDTESFGCDFHASKTETLFSGEVIDDICATGGAWGPFEFNYPEYDNGQIFINSISVGLIGGQVCISTDGVCGVFFQVDQLGHSCGSGYFCFHIDDEWMIAGTACANGCGSSTTFEWVMDDGTGFTISAQLTVTIA